MSHLTLAPVAAAIGNWRAMSGSRNPSQTRSAGASKRWVTRTIEAFRYVHDCATRCGRKVESWTYLKASIVRVTHRTIEAYRYVHDCATRCGRKVEFAGSGVHVAL